MKKNDCWLWQLKVGQLKKQWKNSRFPKISCEKARFPKKELGILDEPKVKTGKVLT